mmetsp:Transcript_783/g.1645  ORF Transcript_783/g.1645 Transcript_783/m.1645 type:complete len:558 (-) Transcript_783:42-1715(-)
MFVGKNSCLFLSYIALAMIIRFGFHQRLIRPRCCAALSPRRSHYRQTNIARESYLATMRFPNSATAMSLSSPGQESEHQQKKIHLNHAGASPSPQHVLDRVFSHLQLEQQSGGYAAQNSVQESGDLDEVYNNVARLIHATETLNDRDSSPSTVAPEIALVESATVGWTRAFYAMVQRDEEERRARAKVDPNLSSSGSRVILITEAEYAANVVAACQWARDHDDQWMVLAIPSSVTPSNNSTGIVDLKAFDKMLEGRFRYKNKLGEEVLLDPSSISMVCITHVPTNSGIVNPVEEIGQRIASYNQRQQEKAKHRREEWTHYSSIKYLVDACQSVGQMDVNVQRIKCDALVATGRKYLRGPRGTGFLYVSNDILAQDIMPSHIDHYGCPVSSVPSTASYQSGAQLQDNEVIQFAPREGAKRFEFWESSISSRLGLGEAVCVAMEKGLADIARDIQQLSSLLRVTLEEKVPNIEIHHTDSTTCGIVTFYCHDVDARTVQAEMWVRGFELSFVPATSTPLDSSTTNVPDLVRASISYTTTENEIYKFCDTLASYLRLTSVI